jgi:hypothetical protein
MRTEIQEYIVKNYFELLKIAKRITRGHELYNDLLNDIILQMYERESEIKLKTYEDNDIKYYITAIMRVNWMSKTSPFYYRYKRSIDLSQPLSDNYENQADDFDERMDREVLIQCLEISFSELNWFHKSVFEMYLTLGSLKAVSKKTGVPLSSIARYVKQSKEEIRNNTNEKYNNGN